jgi:hypothetical protein
MMVVKLTEPNIIVCIYHNMYRIHLFNIRRFEPRSIY